MQKVAAYLLERRDGLHQMTLRNAEALRVRAAIDAWLISKGGQPSSLSGVYTPIDGSVGKFTIDSAQDGDSSWWMVRLTEDASDGRRFMTAVSVTCANELVSVYVTMETGWSTTRIMPISVDARTPRVVRDLLELPGRWYHGPSTLRRHSDVCGFENGEVLAAEIAHSDRTIPFIVVSRDENNQIVLPELSEKLAFDLSGLANVVCVDEDAAWALTDVLGQRFGCYRGAVRMYWPHFSANQDPLFHPRWTADMLRRVGSDDQDARERIRKRFRHILFRASALSVIRPRAIDSIRENATHRDIAELRKRASSLQDFEELADSYATDNARLRLEKGALADKLEEMATTVAKLEQSRQALLSHLSAKNGGLAESMSDIDLDADEAGEAEVDRAPDEGDVRFYKKVHSRPSHDVMRRVGDCNCNNWEGSHAADKARKGIARLEGRSDWKTMQHCASCTGGGMWKVRW